MLEHFKKHWKAADDEFVPLDEVSRPDGVGAGVAGWTNNVVASLDFLTSKENLDIDGFKKWLIQVSGYLSKQTFDKAMEEVPTARPKRARSTDREAPYPSLKYPTPAPDPDDGHREQVRLDQAALQGLGRRWVRAAPPEARRLHESLAIASELCAASALRRARLP